MNNNINDLEKSFDYIEIPAELDLTIEKAIQSGKKLKRKNTSFKLFATAASIVFIICSGATLGIASGKLPLAKHNKSFEEISKNNSGTKLSSIDKKLPLVGDVDNLKTLIAGTFPKQETLGGMGVTYDGMSVKDYKTPLDKNMSNSADYSTTNTQVSGIDEGDNVKTDGEYIYKLTYPNNTNQIATVQIIKALPSQNMSIVGNVKINGMTPSQIFINNHYLIVIGFFYSNDSANIIAPENQYSTVDYIRPTSTAVNIYDIHDKSNINLMRHIEVDGNFATARTIDSKLYFISNKYIYKNWIEKTEEGLNLFPTYKDSVIGSVTNNINLNQVNYCPAALEPNYIIIASIDLNKINNKIMITATLGSGHNIFCSEDNLYVAGYNFNNKSYTTTIYKFKLNSGSPIFVSSAMVPGNILNQFSMDEFNKYFRVTTTSSITSENSSSTPTNNLYVLDENMNLVGKLEGLAKGEQIYSTRFMDDRAYMVTFKQTDPLFVIDLKNPNAPKVLGELKLPGVSNYLQPYDKNILLSIGMNTEVSNNGNLQKVLPKGLKLALFDVSDVNNPKQIFMTTIGDANTFSPALYDHKALLFSKEKNLLSFPVTIQETKKDKNGIQILNDTFQGAYVYNIDATNGFILKGSITHMDTQYPSNKAFNPNSMISKVLYINNILYTISESTIKANDINDLQEISSLKLR